MIAEFIDGYNNFISPKRSRLQLLPSGSSPVRSDVSSFCEACPHGDLFRTQSFRGGLCPLSWVSTFLLAPSSLGFSFHPYHLYQEQLHHQRATLRLGLPFLLSRLRSHLDWSR